VVVQVDGDGVRRDELGPEVGGDAGEGNPIRRSRLEGADDGERPVRELRGLGGDRQGHAVACELAYGERRLDRRHPAAGDHDPDRGIVRPPRHGIQRRPR
jgi:hypothetical protein